MEAPRFECRCTRGYFSSGLMKRYLITGASRGIGRAIAEELATQDAILLLHGRDTVALAQTRKAVEPECASVRLLVHDLATSAGVSDLIRRSRQGANRPAREQ